MKPAVFVWIALLLPFSNSVPAQAFDGGFVATFVGLCLLTEAKPDMAKAAATAGKWEPVPSELLPLIAPQVPPLEWDAWMVKGEGDPLIVSVSTSDLDGERIPACAIAGSARYADIEAAISQFGATLISEVNEVIQISRTYEVVQNGNRMLIALTLAPNSTEGMLSAGVVDVVD